MKLTEWVEDGETRLRHITLDSSIIGEPNTRLSIDGNPLTPEELVVFHKIVEGVNEMARVMKSEPEPHCECHERDSSYTCDYCKSQGEYGHMELNPANT